MAKAVKQHEPEDFFVKLAKGIEKFISEHIKILIISVAVIVVGLAAYFTADYMFDRREESAYSEFGSVYLEYKDILETEEIGETADTETVNEKLLNLNEDLKKVIEAFPKSFAASESAYFIGNTLYRVERYEEAVEYFKKGYSSRSKPPIAVLCLLSEASCYEQLDDYAAAEETYKRIVSEFNDSFMVPLAKFNLGQLYEKQDKYALAEQEYTEIVTQYDWSSWKELAEKRLLIIKSFI
jgi:tetratricopeptide (TPR) repeat protein